MRDIYYVNEDIGLPDFVQGAFEGFDQLCGQFPDEADGVGKQERAVFDHDFPDGRVQGGEELVFREDVRFGQEVHQGALAYVRVTNERQAHQRTAIAALGGHLTVDLLQVLLELGDALLDDPPVHLDLGFTHTASGTHTAALPLQVRPHTGQPG